MSIKAIGPKTFQIAIWVLVAVKVILAFLFPLTSDEGYYWLWSKHLALSYVDHPPMIAWINWLLVRIFWEPLIALRAGALMLNGLIAWVLFEISKELFGTQKTQAVLHWRNLFLFLLIPNTFIIWLVLTVELPFVLFYLLAVLFFIKFLKSRRDAYLYGVGIWVGLGLLTKYTMVLFYPLVLIFVLSQKKFHFLLRRLSFWLSGFVGCLIFSPVLIAGFLQSNESILFHAARVGTHAWFSETIAFAGEQLIYLSPFLAYFIFRFYADPAAKKFSHAHPEMLFTSLAGLIPFVFFAVLSLKTHVWPHWPVVAYGLFVLLVGFWFSDKSRIFRLRRLLWGMLAFDLLLLLVLLVFSPGVLKEQGHYRQNYQMASQISGFLKQHPQTLFASDYHGSVAQLSYYGRVEVLMPVELLAVEDGTWGKKQFARWQKRPLPQRADLVVLTRPGSRLYVAAQKYFRSVEPLPGWQLHVMEGHLQGQRFFWFKDFRPVSAQL